MATKAGGTPTIRERDVRGLKYFDQLAPLLERLHDVGCESDRAGNRVLHYDQYGMLVLLFLFNPIVTSLRGLQQASELQNSRRGSAARAPRWGRFPNRSVASIPSA